MEIVRKGSVDVQSNGEGIKRNSSERSPWSSRVTAIGYSVNRERSPWLSRVTALCSIWFLENMLSGQRTGLGVQE